jgi:GT2 family glycosyltransferase
MDGLFFAVKSETLLRTGLRFDEGFKFHFYDLDFCRQAEVLNLKMGTIGLSVTHESNGNFNTDSWRSAYKDYLQKWKD